MAPLQTVHRLFTGSFGLQLLTGLMLAASSDMLPSLEAVQAKPTEAPGSCRVHINRAGKRLYLISEKNEVIFDCPIGIGRGGLRQKTSMSDEVTPTGDFVVDIILSPDPQSTAIAPRYHKRYHSNKAFHAEIQSKQALANMFKHMNSMDFNHDGNADDAYGIAYFGLSSDNAVTGPKLRRHAGTVYWYSIAMHGTSTPDNIGKANSGGCIHVPKKHLSRLLVDKLMIINSRVTIRDQPPQLKAGLPDRRQAR